LQLKIGPEVPQYVVIDSAALEQVLTNLVGNAIKFTDSGTVEISLDLRTQESHPLMVIRISDTGIGIPEEKLELLFDPFTQLDASSTRKHEGAGLGLAIAKSLVDQMEGQIRIQSQRGSGTLIEIELPYSEESSGSL